MTSGDFDFFGAPTTPPPTGPAGQFGMPAAPSTNQFGTPAAPITPGTAPTLRSLTPAPKPGNGGQIGIIAGVAAAIVLATAAFVWLQGVGKKQATKVATTVEGPIVKAHQTVETMDLQQASQAEETYLVEHSVYATATSALTGFAPSANTTVTVVSATATGYCLRADDSSSLHAPSMYLTSFGGASTTPCS